MKKIGVVLVESSKEFCKMMRKDDEPSQSM